MPLGVLLGAPAGEPAPVAPRPLLAERGAVWREFDRGLDSLTAALERLQLALAAGPPRAAAPAFRDARAAYKRAEPLLEVLAPAAVEALNGPAPEASEDKPYLPLGAPAGFQTIEPAVFSPRGPARDSLVATARVMTGAITSLRAVLPRVAISDTTLLDALRLEVARVATLGVAGFDVGPSGDAIVESAAALEGSRALVRRAADGAPRSPVPWSAVDMTLARAAAYLRAHSSADSLDRLTFIVSYANPAARAVLAARLALWPPPPLRRLWRQDAATVFERNALDPWAYAPVAPSGPTAEMVALGRRLFFDPALSGARTRSCAFCHQPGRAFSDGFARSTLLAPPVGPHRNTPTLLNAAYAPALFDDLRATSLEMQAALVLANPAELGSSAALAAERLRHDSTYRAGFRRAFDGSARDITPDAVTRALAAYVRSLSALDSRFDRAVQGDTAALSAEERQGFTLFMGKGRCGTCHFLPLFNGTMPPDFVRSEAEIIGVTDRPGRIGARVDPDSGLARIDLQPVHRGAFKVPTLRNVAVTAPYMHNGAFRTLEQVVDFYDRGGAAGSGLDLPGQTLPSDSLHLSHREKHALVAFLDALTDTTSVAIPSTVGVSARPERRRHRVADVPSGTPSSR